MKRTLAIDAVLIAAGILLGGFGGGFMTAMGLACLIADLVLSR